MSLSLTSRTNMSNAVSGSSNNCSAKVWTVKFLPPPRLRKSFPASPGQPILSAVADADLVIEAVFEDKQVKSDLFKKLDRLCSAKTILATNTSSFFVREFAAQTSRPDRFIGLHYFYHPAKNRLLEVIPHQGTSAETLREIASGGKTARQNIHRRQRCPGFCR